MFGSQNCQQEEKSYQQQYIAEEENADGNSAAGYLYEDKCGAYDSYRPEYDSPSAYAPVQSEPHRADVKPSVGRGAASKYDQYVYAPRALDSSSRPDVAQPDDTLAAGHLSPPHGEASGQAFSQGAGRAEMDEADSDVSKEYACNTDGFTYDPRCSLPSSDSWSHSHSRGATEFYHHQVEPEEHAPPRCASPHDYSSGRNIQMQKHSAYAPVQSEPHRADVKPSVGRGAASKYDQYVYAPRALDSSSRPDVAQPDDTLAAGHLSPPHGEASGQAFSQGAGRSAHPHRRHDEVPPRPLAASGKYNKIPLNEEKCHAPVSVVDVVQEKPEVLPSDQSLVQPKDDTPLTSHSDHSTARVACVHLSVAERKLTTAYFKMLKVGIPPQSIAEKMSWDGLPIDMSRRVLLEMGVEHHVSGTLRAATLSAKKKLLRLYWKPLNADNLSTSSLWSNSLDTDLNVIPDCDELSEIEKLFGVSPSKVLPPVKVAAASKSSRAKRDAQRLPVVLDMQRSTNISIGLAYYKDVGSMRCILNAVCSLHSMNKRLTMDRLLNLSVMLPHLSEARALQGVETSNKAEMFCKLAMEYYPHLAGRLSCFLTMSQFAEIQQTVIPKLQLHVQALDAIMQSKRLALIINKMLFISNAFNAGTSIGATVGLTLSSLSYAMTLRGGANKDISVVDFAVRSLREKGHTDILQVVEDIKLIEDMAHTNTASLASEVTAAENEYADLAEQLKVAEDYLVFYHQGAMERWIKAKSGETLVMQEEDLVNTPFGPGTVKEVRPNGMLKVRPLKWHLKNEVVHTMIIHKDVVSIRAPVVVGEVVGTQHGAGVVVDVLSSDSVVVIRPLTWSMSSKSIPLIYEPIAGLRPLHDPIRQNVMPSSESHLPKLTLSFVSTLKAFMKSSNEKMSEMKRLKELMNKKIGDVGKYFGECEESFNLTEMVNILRQFRNSLLPMCEVDNCTAVPTQILRDEHVTTSVQKAKVKPAPSNALLTHTSPQNLRAHTALPSSSSTTPLSVSRHFVDVRCDDSSDSDYDSEASRKSPSNDIADNDSASYVKWLSNYHEDISNQSIKTPPSSTGMTPARMKSVFYDNNIFLEQALTCSP